MTKRNGTKQELMRFHEEIEMWRQQNSLSYHMNVSKIKDFYKMNQVRISGIIEQMREIDLAHYQHDMVDGQPVFKWEGEGKDRKPTLIEGKVEEDHKNAYRDLLKEETVIHLW